jgi:hypothetical protein
MYFGDGIYGEFDGYHVTLTANGIGAEATDRIYLEPGIAERIVEWIKARHPDYNTGRPFANP